MARGKSAGGGFEEFTLIDQLAAKLRLSRRTILGPGDDCAILSPARSPQVVTVDSMVEGVHFRLEWTTPEALGVRSLTVNLSDVAAMGGTPSACVINLAIREGINARFCDRLYTGLAEAARLNETDIVGGNITRASELTITITVIGEIADAALRRDTAKPGDDIFVTGTIGDAAAGLRILSGNTKARGQARKFLTERYLNPTARLTAGRRLARIKPVPAAIDISDGLVQDLGHILKRSKVGAEVDTGAIPLSEAYRALFGSDATLALNGGDDYELLFCMRPGQYAGSLSRRLGVPISRIGRIVRGGGVILLNSDGSRVRADPMTGWNQLHQR
jgi:thiamine-monophosphate kinase